MDEFQLKKESFPKTVGKTAVLNTAATFGVFTGMLLFGAMRNYLEERKTKREASENKDK